MGVKGLLQLLNKDFPMSCFEISKMRKGWTQAKKGKNGIFQIPIKDQQMDHLYIDLNSIIHTALLSVNKSLKPKKPETEKKMPTEEEIISSLEKMNLEEDNEENEVDFEEEIVENEEIEDEDFQEEEEEVIQNLQEILDSLIVNAPNDDFLNTVCSKVLKKLTNIFSNFQPQRTYFISMDGPAPITKMKKQKKDKLKPLMKQETESVSKSLLSPGTIMMIKLKEEIKIWAEENYKTGFFDSSLTFYISGSDEVGEGETKIMNHISNYQENYRRESYGIVTPDSDMILMALGCISKENILIFNPTKMSRKFNCVSKVKLLEHFNKLVPAKANEIALDFVLLILLKGNDYLPGIGRWTKFYKVFENYLEFKNNDISLIEFSNVGYKKKGFTLNLETLSKIHSYDLHFDKKNYTSESKINDYLDALLWNFNMYVSSLCYDYEQNNVGSIKMSDIAGLVHLKKQKKKSLIFESTEIKQRDHPLNHFLFSFCILPKPCFVYFPKEVIDLITPELDEILQKNYVGKLDLNEISMVSKNLFDKYPETRTLFYQNNQWKEFEKVKIAKFYLSTFEFAKNKSFHKLVPKMKKNDEVENKPIKNENPQEFEKFVEIEAVQTKKEISISKVIDKIVKEIAESQKIKEKKKVEMNQLSRWKKDGETEKTEKIEIKPRMEKKQKTFKFHFNNDEKSPIAATGALLYKFVDNEMLILMIDKSSKFEDLGGKVDQTDETVQFTAAREIEEESNLVIKIEDIIKRLENSKNIYLPPSKYLLYFVKATSQEEKLAKKDFGDVEKNDNIKRTISWISRKELEEAKLNNKINYRLKNLKIFKTLSKIDAQNQKKNSSNVDSEIKE
eukprot:gene9118-1208_t